MTANIEIDLDSRELLDTAELAKLIGVSESAIRKASARQEGRARASNSERGKGMRMITIPPITRIGNRIKFRRKHVDAWLDQLAGFESNSESIESEWVRQGEKSKRASGRPRSAYRKSIGGAA